MIKIYKNDGSGGNGEFVVWSDDLDGGAFVRNLGPAILESLEKYKGDEDFTIVGILDNAFPLYLKILGYKAEQVKEIRALISGFSMPDQCSLVSTAGK